MIDAGEDNGRPYIVFEYIEGRTLKRRIQEEGRLPVDEAVAYAIEIGRGLTAAHARKLVHRDVKPQNVLIDPEGRAKVTDFGIARSLEQKGMTATGRVLGTTDYVSPEQAMGEDVDERSDVYSLGVVLYEMLTGDVPFQAETQVGVAMKHVNEPMPDVQAKRPEVSAQLAAVVDRSTTKPARPLPERGPSSASRADARGGGSPPRRDQRRGDERARLGSVLAPRLGTPRSRLGSRWGSSATALIAGGLIFGAEHIHLGGSSSPPSSAGTEVRLPTDAASEFDPSPGDGRETGTERLAVDSNPTGTDWTSEHYDTEDFGGLKDGVGLAIDAGHRLGEVDAVIAAPPAGTTRRSTRPADRRRVALRLGQPVATITNGGATETIGLPGSPAESFPSVTKLPQAQDHPGKLQMEISDVRLTK